MQAQHHQHLQQQQHYQQMQYIQQLQYQQQQMLQQQQAQMMMGLDGDITSAKRPRSNLSWNVMFDLLVQCKSLHTTGQSYRYFDIEYRWARSSGPQCTQVWCCDANRWIQSEPGTMAQIAAKAPSKWKASATARSNATVSYRQGYTLLVCSFEAPIVAVIFDLVYVGIPIEKSRMKTPGKEITTL